MVPFPILLFIRPLFSAYLSIFLDRVASPIYLTHYPNFFQFILTDFFCLFYPLSSKKWERAEAVLSTALLTNKLEMNGNIYYLELLSPIKMILSH